MSRPPMSRTYLLARAAAFSSLAQGFSGFAADQQAFYAARAEFAAWHAARSA